MIIPYGCDETVRRFPWVTVGLMVFCTAIQFTTSLRAPTDAELTELVSEYQRAQSEDDTERMEEIQSEAQAAVLGWFGTNWGYRPTMRVHVNTVLYSFVHGGWLHLIGNMLFLWVVGFCLENRWGKAPFAAFWALGSMAAALTYALWHPGSRVPLVGASGGVAAALGAFLICFHKSKLHCFYWYWVRIGTFQVRAYVALPVWFLGQLGWSYMEANSDTPVAYSAHVGGFVFGAVLALALKRTGWDKKFLARVGDDEEVYLESPVFAAADRLRRGERAEAAAMFRKVLAGEPRSVLARRHLLQMAIDDGDPAEVPTHARIVFPAIVGENQGRDAVLLYTTINRLWPDMVLDDRTLASVAKAAEVAQNGELAVAVTRKLIQEFPQSSVTPGAMWRISWLQANQGRDDLANKTLQLIVQRYPADPIAEQARARLAGRPTPRPSVPPSS